MSTVAGTNPHFLDLAHTVHVRAVGRVSSLLIDDIVIVADGGIVHAGDFLIVNWHFRGVS